MKKVFTTLLAVLVLALALSLSIFITPTNTYAKTVPATISDAFGVKLGDVFDASKSISCKRNNDGSIIYGFKPDVNNNNNVFEEYVVETDKNNVIYLIFARAKLDKEKAIVLKDYLITNFKIKYGITDSYIEKNDNTTVLHQGSRAIALSIKDNQVSIMFLDISYAYRD